MVDPAALLRRLLRSARSEHGFTLVELLTVMIILSLVLMGVTALYLSGVRTQGTLTADFEAQTSLHTGLDLMRKDVHQACSETTQSATSVTLSLPPCDGTKTVTWCTRASGTVYGLYRISGSACSGGTKEADFLTGGSIFTYTAQNSPVGSYALPRLHIDMTVNATPATPATGYHVVDDLVFENGVRQ